MSDPRHLWSGDWQLESAARTDELAARRARAEPPAEDAPAAEPAARAAEPVPTPAPRAPRPRPSPAALRRRIAASRLARLRWRRIGLVMAAVALLGAGAAYAASSLLTQSGRSQPVALNGSRPWLGVKMSSSPSGGVLVDAVEPGSPAEAAGVEPGDVITQIDTEPVGAPAIVAAAIDGMRPGDQVEIQLQRGRATYTAHVTLATRPARAP